MSRQLNKTGRKCAPLNWLEKLSPAVRDQVEAFCRDVVTVPGFTAAPVARGIIEWLVEQNQPAPRSIDPVIRYLRQLKRQSSVTA